MVPVACDKCILNFHNWVSNEHIIYHMLLLLVDSDKNFYSKCIQRRIMIILLEVTSTHLWYVDPNEKIILVFLSIYWGLHPEICFWDCCTLLVTVLAFVWLLHVAHLWQFLVEYWDEIYFEDYMHAIRLDNDG